MAQTSTSEPESIGAILPRVLSRMAEKISPELRADIRLVAKTFAPCSIWDAEAQVWRRVRIANDSQTGHHEAVNAPS